MSNIEVAVNDDELLENMHISFVLHPSAGRNRCSSQCGFIAFNNARSPSSGSSATEIQRNREYSMHNEVKH